MTVQYRCRYCKREVSTGPGESLPLDRCWSAGPKGWHLWKRITTTKEATR